MWNDSYLFRNGSYEKKSRRQGKPQQQQEPWWGSARRPNHRNLTQLNGQYQHWICLDQLTKQQISGSLQTKRVKGAHSSNLQADWKKIVGLTTKSVRYSSIRVSDEELIPAASETHSCSMSGASSHSSTSMSCVTTLPFEGDGDGEFDHDETPESLAATWKHKGSNPKLPKKTGTAGMKSVRVTANVPNCCLLESLLTTVAFRWAWHWHERELMMLWWKK